MIDHLEEKGWFDNGYIIVKCGFSAVAFILIEFVTIDNGEYLKSAGMIDSFVDRRDLTLQITDWNAGDTAAAANEAKLAELLEACEALGYCTTLYSCTEQSLNQFSLRVPV